MGVTLPPTVDRALARARTALAWWSEGGPEGRLRSLDAARGLAVAGLLVVENLHGDPDDYPSFRHALWNGWTFADLVFPAFLFLVGTSLAFFLRSPPTAAAYRRLARRAVALIVLGLLFNAWGTSGTDLSQLRIPGVLQRIGLASFVGALIVIALKRWWLVVLAALVLMTVYGGLLPGSSPSCPATAKVPVDRCTVAGEVDLDLFGPDHLYQQGQAGHDPEGLLSTIGAVATVLLGYLAGQVVRLHRRHLATSGVLLAIGLICLWGSGHLWQSTPVNKRLWTPPFVLLTAWANLALIAICYAVVDVGGRLPVVGLSARAAGWVWEVLGRNALVVYIGQHFLARALEQTTVDGGTGVAWVQQHLVGGWGPNAVVAYVVFVALLWWAVAAAMHALRWYVTI